jgi:hypothetical protein
MESNENTCNHVRLQEEESEEGTEGERREKGMEAGNEKKRRGKEGGRRGRLSDLFVDIVLQHHCRCSDVKHCRYSDATDAYRCKSHEL